MSFFNSEKNKNEVGLFTLIERDEDPGGCRLQY
jgi:hypothetical protein